MEEIKVVQGGEVKKSWDIDEVKVSKDVNGERNGKRRGNK